MIPRKEPDGTMFLVPQTEHSRLAGQFAAHWGNETFAPLQPYESVARAAAFHDFGYLRYETAPAYVAATGETPFFRDVQTDAQRLEEYRWVFDWFMGLDPYASLLVNMHRTGLWQQRYKTIRSKPGRVKNEELPEVYAFIKREEARRPELIANAKIDAKQLWINYRLLQCWDLMSLYFSCAVPTGEEVIDPVPTSYEDADDQGVRLTMSPVDEKTVAIDPYPFDAPNLRVTLLGRRFPKAQYESQDAFRKAYFQAQAELLEYTLVPGDRTHRTEAGLVGAAAR